MTTHIEHAEEIGVPDWRPCTAGYITFGGKCLNCGYVPCQVCKVRQAIAGVYCQFCLDKETEDMTSDELF